MSHTVNLTSENFADVVDNNDLVFIDFWADWCGPCKSFAPVFEAAAENNTDIVFAKIDTENARDLAGQFGIRSIPTLMVFKEQVVVFSQPGAMQQAQLNHLVEEAKKLDMDMVRAEIAKNQAEETTA
jgi:thioredoxin